MLDNLRSQASFEPGDEQPESFEPEKPQKPQKQRRFRKPGKTLDQLTRMKAPQRFMLALMLLIVVCLLGTAILFVTGRIILPLGF